jgi:hypothetical protein
MTHRLLPQARIWLTAAAVSALGGAAQAQVFSDNQSDIPQGNPNNNSLSENVDFGDVDLDGDFDAIFADGGDAGNDQNRIWINLAGLQAGTIGIFQDQTSTRFPVFQDDSRDIEFGDFDQDGDLDIYSSNTAQLSNQGNRWWINNGGLQAGTLGFYVDQTSTRWAGLGAAGSSIPPGALIAGTFIDWSCDCDFGDLDNDGDIDLVHSSYGGAFGGEVPTRLFLNNGSGVFTEFNPSGFQLSGNNINNGNPAIWAQGTQSANTTNSNGTNADIASSALDIDVGDIDGDYDLDILHGAREQLPRLFQNRLAENGGSTLAFRDVTGSALPNGYSTGNGHYEQEMGDFDDDGDLDIYGLNWLASFGFDDNTFRNNGAGVYTQIQVLSNSGSDDNEGDFLDYDQDGDLDLFVANFSGSSKLYQGNNTGTLTYQTGSTSGLNVSSFVALDADACDVDEDGDTDMFQSNDGGARNQYWKNNTTGNDTHAPYIPRYEDIANQTASNGVIVRRAQVYDNAPYYNAWYNTTVVRATVNGFTLPDFATESSQGQVFRAEIPKHLVGSVVTTWRSTDSYGNTGVSSNDTWTSTYGGTYQEIYGAPSVDVNGNSPTLTAVSLSIPGRKLYLAVQGQANQTIRFAYAPLPQIPGAAVPPFGLIHLDLFTLFIYQTLQLDGNGRAIITLDVPSFFIPGNSIYFQVLAGIPTFPGVSWSMSPGLRVIHQ